MLLCKISFNTINVTPFSYKVTLVHGIGRKAKKLACAISSPAIWLLRLLITASSLCIKLATRFNFARAIEQVLKSYRHIFIYNLQKSEFYAGIPFYMELCLISSKTMMYKSDH